MLEKKVVKPLSQCDVGGWLAGGSLKAHCNLKMIH